ncbi:MAG: bifunctional riboflavin kinase/FAD synthetase, partial [Magnetococcales bacterium]|nr:bifunctional riboflavin kinase/FAD synthetase [Magnetococcales bacterium]
MYIIRGLGNLPPRFRGSAITIGNFDGVHLGHQAVFHALCLRARALAAHAMAITFEPHPVRLLHPERAPPRITGVRGKARWMEAYGVDAMLILRFTRELASLPAETFVSRVLVEQLAVRDVLVGYDFRFGAGGRGDFAGLCELGRHHGFQVARQEALQLADGV